ncbi:hypothetical protein M9H77_13793 [Catharanthus roseus]|uniref:Uncharacterized protein n=1 Tax=Catharanthus roseus TaxID=4058 RepID=A0ACC0BL77_CATRO|nr:hypothetical protein M9H77_13793 [Catharanthus roseus]
MAATSSCFQPLTYSSYSAAKDPGFCSIISENQKRRVKFSYMKAKASGNEPSTKKNSVLCADCDGNGAVKCSQCKGNGVNSVDHFGGRFKAGDSCWLCGGKKNVLCGNCNGAGFIGGFMTSSDT